MDGPRGEILSVGSEIVLGEIVDTNAAYLAGELAVLGVDVRRVTQLGDDVKALTDAFIAARERSAVVVITGGLGPTHDDLTREALAAALGEPLTVDEGLETTLRERFRRIGPMSERNLQQAMIVPSAVPLPNPIGSAPGWWVDRDETIVALLPGVPSEMRRMWTEQVVPRLRARFALQPLHRRAVRCFAIGESAVAERLGTLLEGSDPAAGIYARDDGVHVRFSTRGDRAALDGCVAEAAARLGDDVYSVDDQGLAEVTLRALGAAGVETLGTVELGTGGALLSILSDLPDTSGSARFVGGMLSVDAAFAPRPADLTLTVTVDAARASGLTPLTVRISGVLGEREVRARIFGSGAQRLRRAAFAALDQVRRLAAASGA